MGRFRIQLGRRDRQGSDSDAAAPGQGKPIEPVSGKKTPVRFLILFFAIFLVFGGLFPYLFTIRPLLKGYAARNWQPVPCTVQSSKVKSHRSSDGTTYSMDVRFEYEWQGQVLQSDRFDFIDGSSSGYSHYKAQAKRYPAGSKQTCYVNPADPTQAVLSRQFNQPLWMSLLPFIFPLVGAVGLFFTIRYAWRQRRIAAGDGIAAISTPAPAKLFSRSTSTPSRKRSIASATGATGPVTLKASNSRVKTFIGVLFFTVFWNGIVFGFLVPEVIDHWRSASGFSWLFTIFFTLFATPFVLVGVGTAAAVVYTFMCLFNPRAQVSVSRQALPLGGEMEANWQIIGNAGKIRRVRLYVQGVEQAQYQRGTSTYTDTNVFAHIDLADITDPTRIGQGKATLQLPADTMHSFAGSHNKIIWRLCVRGQIPRWPNVSQDFPITVTPLDPAMSPPAMEAAT
ncbi:MAG: DUF3592 domain-containing protein [Phycisphaeraceae bacterium]